LKHSGAPSENALAMGVQQNVKPEPRQGAKLTLGDVLYADRKVPQESEQVWLAFVHAVVARDAQALHSLYQRSNRLVYTLALRITGSPETAEELTLQVFYDVWTDAAAYHPDGGTVLGWIMSRARARALERVVADKLAEGGSREALPFEERARVLTEALKRLTPEEREAIETTYFSELTHADTAARLKQPAGSIKTRIGSGLTKLRQALAGNT
jgi:RNA polymerase sigma-70 factor (ECF subfamily)